MNNVLFQGLSHIELQLTQIFSHITTIMFYVKLPIMIPKKVLALFFLKKTFHRLPPLPRKDPTARDGRRDCGDEGDVARGVVQLPQCLALKFIKDKGEIYIYILFIYNMEYV